MTLDKAKTLLSENNISFELHEFNSEAEYWHHTTLFPYTKNAKPCKVIAMIIRSNNGKKDIELQFNAVGDVFRFQELRFGDFCYEMFDYNEDMLADDLIRNILEIKQGNRIMIVLNDIRKKRGSVKLYAQIFFGIWQKSITRDLVLSLCCFLVG